MTPEWLEREKSFEVSEDLEHLYLVRIISFESKEGDQFKVEAWINDRLMWVYRDISEVMLEREVRDIKRFLPDFILAYKNRMKKEEKQHEESNKEDNDQEKSG